MHMLYEAHLLAGPLHDVEAAELLGFLDHLVHGRELLQLLHLVVEPMWIYKTKTQECHMGRASHRSGMADKDNRDWRPHLGGSATGRGEGLAGHRLLEVLEAELGEQVLVEGGLARGDQ